MINFLRIFSNEFKFIIRQGTTSQLILLYPIIIMLLIGPAFNSSSLAQINVAAFGSSTLLDKLDSVSSINLIPAPSAEDALNLVKSKSAVMAFIFEDSAGEGTKVNVYIDSSKKPVVDTVLLLLDKSIAEETSISANEILELQSQLSLALDAIDQKSSDISAFKYRINEFQDNLSIMQTQANALSASLSGSQEELNQLSQNINVLVLKMDSFSANLSHASQSMAQISKYTDDISSYVAQIAFLQNASYAQENERDAQVIKINSTISKLDYYDSRLAPIQSNIALITDSLGPANPFYSELSSIESNISSVRADIRQTKEDLEYSRDRLDSIDFAGYRNTLAVVKDDLIETRYNISSFVNDTSDAMGSMQENVVFFNSSVDELDTNLQQINLNMDKFYSYNNDFLNFITSLKSASTSLKAGVIEMQTLLSQIREPMRSFVQTSREDILPPVIRYEDVFVRNDPITILFPVILGIDMLLASLLLPMIMSIRLKDQGLLYRLKMSRIGSFSVIFGRFLGNYFICLLQVFILALVGVLVFNVYYGNLLSLLFVLLLAPIVFTSIGMLLSQFVNTTSTAFMLSLLISIPLIFLSGSIVPLEFLNPPMDFLGSLLPLHTLIDVTEKLMFRDLGVLSALGSIVYLLFISIVSLGLAMVYYKSRNLY
ncbi:MAG: ABC transporter permease [Candidatus Micrarchaeota archaeon]